VAGFRDAIALALVCKSRVERDALYPSRLSTAGTRQGSIWPHGNLYDSYNSKAKCDLSAIDMMSAQQFNIPTLSTGVVMRKFFLLAFSLFVIDPAAHAGTLLFQSIPDLTVAPQDVWCSSCGNVQARVFDTFTLSNNAAVTSLTFAVKSTSLPEPIDVSVWSLNGNSPIAQLFHQTIAPDDFISVINTAHDTSLVTVVVPHWSLAGGSYDISFFNEGSLGVASYTGGSGLISQPPFDLSGLGESAGFALFGTMTAAVPEPSTWAMMLLGFAGLGYLGYRRRAFA
jgi:PEP-CTERM motif